jgi:hypothetical protein
MKSTVTRSYKILKGTLGGDGPRITFRLTHGEARQLVIAATRLGVSVSQLIRDTMYDVHQIGEFERSGKEENVRS